MEGGRPETLAVRVATAIGDLCVAAGRRQRGIGERRGRYGQHSRTELSLTETTHRLRTASVEPLARVNHQLIVDARHAQRGIGARDGTYPPDAGTECQHRGPAHAVIRAAIQLEPVVPEVGRRESGRVLEIRA